MLAAVTALALAVGLAHATPAAADESARPAGEHYVALGDSYVAGPGIEGQVHPGCGRSDRNYPSLVASALGTASFTDASCSAATTKHLWTPQSTYGEMNPAQLDALRPTTTLVTLGTIGGNDIDIAGIAGVCILSGCAEPAVEEHRAAIDALEPVYRGLIAEIRRRSPLARIVTVGYGTAMPSTACEALGTATETDLRYVQGLVDRLSDTLRRVASEEAVSFVEMRDLPGWQEHSACAAPEAQWIRGLETHGDGVQLHPSALGMVAMAGHVLKTITAARPAPPAESQPLPSAPPVTSPKPVPSPAPTAKPVPTSAQRLGAAVSTLRLRAVCSGPRASRRVTLRISGGHGLVRGSTFRLGRSVIARDTRAPFTLTRSSSALKRTKFRGAASARVVLRHGTASRAVMLRAPRPGCLR
ncbi:hypothetical protein H1W00_00065 [Aeromicrobium sp. Marseille-Q0843]|uniref:SGNH hydrolase-type esterase domain-containing protein n=1 Tax=Aeromicrobium phoceense TaxID=2754045 RepID=A0A838XDK0_9ACTN|nr:GDSL-type esterase/lipase family protein [Aeromicrobium phoceense]MBA4606868.1 hypothetical protein [Aeromicrobium phoceense]